MPEIQGQLNIHIERTIRVTITLPTTHLYKFMEEFGRAFAIDTVTDICVLPAIRSVSKYGTESARSDGKLSFAHFTILAEEKEKFSDFVIEFASQNGIMIPDSGLMQLKL